MTTLSPLVRAALLILFSEACFAGIGACVKLTSDSAGQAQVVFFRNFGTGYSSLKYLKELPIDGIKIDRSFVKDIGIDRNDETIIEAMLSMADSLGMYCIAEGVETDQQLLFFSKRGCYLIQGYLFGKPMPALALAQLLNQSELSLEPKDS